MDGRPTTWSALLTPPGRGAIATLVVCGPGAAGAVDRCFVARRPDRWRRGALREIALGRWGAEPGEEIVACRTADERIELHCHGGPAAARRILDDLLAAGVTERTWQRQIAADCADPWQAAALQQLVAARTQRTAAILLDQYHGALRRELAVIERCVTAGKGDAAHEQVERLLERAKLGRHLVEPWKVVIFGRPNVGKSSLLNALAGYERAIAFDRPGTTRDAVTVQTAVDGWPVELIDTAGLCEATGEMERAGVAQAEAHLARADAALFVADGSLPWSAEDQRRLSLRPEALTLFNKSDLPRDPGSRPAGQWVSCVSGAGLPAVLEWLVARLVPHPPPAAAGVPLTDDQVEHLTSLHRSLHDLV